MITLTADSKCWGNNKQYIARVTGRDSKFTFEREFIGSKNGTVSTARVDDAGLYEICDIDKKGNKSAYFRIVVPNAAGELIELKAGGHNADGQDGTEVAMTIAKRMDGGERIVDMIELTDDGKYRLRTKAQAVKAVKANTLDSVIDSCWSLIAILPEKEQKAVISAIRKRMATAQAPTEITETIQESAIIESASIPVG